MKWIRKLASRSVGQPLASGRPTTGCTRQGAEVWPLRGQSLRRALQVNPSVSRSFRVAQLMIPLSRIVRDNVCIVMTFAFSQPALRAMVDKTFQGQWKYLNETLFDFSAERAEKACIELALFLRMLDDEEKLSHYVKEGGHPGFGKLELPDQTTAVLSLRDVSNKIIHAKSLRWSFATPDRPKLICDAQEKQKWTRAEIDVVAVAGVCGHLMSS